MYHFCSSSDASIGKSSNEGFTSSFLGLPHPCPKESLVISGVTDEADVCSKHTDNVSTSETSTEGVWGVPTTDDVCLDRGVVNKDFGSKWLGVL